ncbi:hypothetical protein F4779DRAFT_613313 [Xylariaceae sp. FL0662B]|nr:hypothetical protein F4779DRAFT_613313 [Xylariaceae sp. FL0662B]
MSATIRLLTHSIRPRGPRITTYTPTHRRPISWIAWEQPNPALYAPKPSWPPPPPPPPPRAVPLPPGKTTPPPPSSSPCKTEVVSAPQPTSLLSRVWGSLMKLTRKKKKAAAATHLPLTQVRYYNNNSNNIWGPESPFHGMLPTTLLCLPHHPATWPCERALEQLEQAKRRAAPPTQEEEAEEAERDSDEAAEAEEEEDDDEEVKRRREEIGRRLLLTPPHSSESRSG